MKCLWLDLPFIHQNEWIKSATVDVAWREGLLTCYLKSLKRKLTSYDCFEARYSTGDIETRFPPCLSLSLDTRKSTSFLRDEFCKKGGIYLLKFIIWYQENIVLDENISNCCIWHQYRYIILTLDNMHRRHYCRCLESEDLSF